MRKRNKAAALLRGAICFGLCVIIVGGVVSIHMQAKDIKESLAAADAPAATEISVSNIEIERVYDDPVVEREPVYYTTRDAVALAQMVWGEARGVDSLTINGNTASADCQKAAAMWCALNRYDAGYEDSIADVVAAPKQFHGYSIDNPVEPELLELAYDVLERWNDEQKGIEDVGRVLPAEYLFFVGDGQHNHFAVDYGSESFYCWELPDVYGEEGVQ